MTPSRAPARTAAALAAAAFAVALAAAPALAGDGGITPGPPGSACLSDDAARQAVVDGRAQRLTAIRRAIDGEILSAQLCMHDGRLVYRVTVLTRSGEAKPMALDARSGNFIQR